ncbi:MAG: glycerophosphodiester phosphodiesterase [Candidatus Limnocylindrales bacterium]
MPEGTPGRPLRLAHRGDWRRAPENTLGAFAAAMTVPGCDGVELDVRLARNGVPVILHDETLARVQRRPERVDALPAEALGQAGIPTLAATLSALPADAFVDVELKGDDHGALTADVLLAARGPSGVRAVVSSFDAPTLLSIGERLQGWRRWLNTEDLAPQTLSLAVGLGCSGVSVLWGRITPRDLRVARDAGLDVAAWTVRRSATFERLGRLGVVACCVEAAALEG